MKRTFLALALTLPFAATATFAQTSTAPTGSADTGMATGSFGGDWSMSLNQALFDTDGTTVRSEEELRTQWETLSEEDKDTLREDCMAYDEQHGSDAGSSAAATGTTSTGTGTGTTAGSDSSAGSTPPVAGSGTAGASADASGSGSSTAMNVTMEQMEAICAVVDDV